MDTIFNKDKKKTPLPQGFYYVNQDNYRIVNSADPDRDNPGKYLYSDGATSCIIVIVTGRDAKGNSVVTLSHLSRRERFLAFFALVARTFTGPVSVFAQGGNPPLARSAVENTGLLLSWLRSNRKADKNRWYINKVCLNLGSGDPRQHNRDCYGINLETMQVSNQRFSLTLEQRDSTGGLQTLFCVFGLQLIPPMVLLNQRHLISGEQRKALLELAERVGWMDILTLTKTEVLYNFSSTPQHEMPWFYTSMRESALLVSNYKLQNRKNSKHLKNGVYI